MNDLEHTKQRMEQERLHMNGFRAGYAAYRRHLGMLNKAINNADRIDIRMNLRMQRRETMTFMNRYRAALQRSMNTCLRLLCEVELMKVRLGHISYNPSLWMRRA